MLDRLHLLTYSQAPAARLTVDEPTKRLDLSRAPSAFFQSKETGRGSVLYRRYDGRHGLVVPAG